MDPLEVKKTCYKCNKNKDFSGFSKNKRTHDGFNVWCKICMKDYQAKWYRHGNNTQQVKTKKHNWYQKNRETELKQKANWYQKNKDQVLERNQQWKKDNHKQHRNQILKKFNINTNDYGQLFNKQGKKCAICRSSKPGRKGVKYLSVDHCHETDKVRGLLCMRCNLLIGQAQDNIDILKSAIDYLEKNL